MTEVLSLANPTGFGRANRLKRCVGELAEALGISERWQCEVAAMLSQLGCVTLPPGVVDKLYHGRPMTVEEQAMTSRMTSVAETLISPIPRLEGVSAILRHQNATFTPSGTGNGPRGEAIPWGSRALRVALDYDTLDASGIKPSVAIGTLRSRMGLYDPAILEALAQLKLESSSPTTVRELNLNQLEPGMVLDSDILSATNLVLVARGQEVTESLRERLRNLPERVGVRQPIRVIVAANSVPAVLAGG